MSLLGRWFSDLSSATPSEEAVVLEGGEVVFYDSIVQDDEESPTAGVGYRHVAGSLVQVPHHNDQEAP
jgi:hypothetical protein